jgi:hypothetical protein
MIVRGVTGILPVRPHQCCSISIRSVERRRSRYPGRSQTCPAGIQRSRLGGSCACCAVGSAPTIQHVLAAIKNRQRVRAPVPRDSECPLRVVLISPRVSTVLRPSAPARTNHGAKEAAAESGKRALAKIRDFLLGEQKSFYPLSNKSRISGRARLSGRSYDGGSSLMTAKGWRPVLTPR